MVLKGVCGPLPWPYCGWTRWPCPGRCRCWRGGCCTCCSCSWPGSSSYSCTPPPACSPAPVSCPDPEPSPSPAPNSQSIFPPVSSHLARVDNTAVRGPHLLEGGVDVVVPDPPAAVLDENSSEAQLYCVIGGGGWNIFIIIQFNRRSRRYNLLSCCHVSLNSPSLRHIEHWTWSRFDYWDWGWDHAESCWLT